MEQENQTGDIDLFTREKQSNEAYEKIKNRKAIVVGCGGVGSVLATILAEGGICDMSLIDMDEFSYADNRQLYSTERNQGKNKAIATAHGVAERTMCYVKPYAGNAIEFFNEGGISSAECDVFLCVDSTDARKEVYKAMLAHSQRDRIGQILDVGVERNTIQVLNYKTKNPTDVYKDDGQAHCTTIPLSSFRAFMAASLMSSAYYSLFETEGTEDEPLVPYDHALQVYTNTMTKFLRKI